MIDLHAHVLAGVDDGPADLDAAVTLCRAMADGGIASVAATSHVSDAYPNSAETLAEARAVLRERLAAEGIRLEVLQGAEVTIERAAALPDAALEGLTLGEGRHLLVESPLSPSAVDVERPLLGVLDRGHPIVLAHPERAPAFQRDPGQLVRLVAAGVLCSVTAGAFAGRFGRTARGLAVDMMAEGLVHDVASDAHDLAGRPPGLGEGLDAAAEALTGLDGIRAWLTEDAPSAILAGRPPGAPPGRIARAPQRRRRRAPWRRRG